MTISDRLKAARAAIGLTQKEVAAQSGVSARGYQGYEDGRSVPGGEAIAGLVRLGINANWLLTGDGPMLLKDLVAAAPKPATVQINVQALAAILHMAQTTAKPGESPEALCLQAVKFYQVAIEQGMITPEGVGDGHLKQVA